MIKSTIYVSKNLLKMPQDEDQLSAIQLLAVARNNDLDLTGIMIVTPAHFAQYLEGEAAPLAAVMASIRRDPRHTDLIAWDPEQLPRRRFPNWRMVFFGPNDDVSRAVNPILAHLNGGLPDHQKIEMIRLMHKLAKQRFYWAEDEYEVP